jgi:hypothetical protein
MIGVGVYFVFFSLDSKRVFFDSVPDYANASQITPNDAELATLNQFNAGLASDYKVFTTYDNRFTILAYYKQYASKYRYNISTSTGRLINGSSVSQMDQYVYIPDNAGPSMSASTSLIVLDYTTGKMPLGKAFAGELRAGGSVIILMRYALP